MMSEFKVFVGPLEHGESVRKRTRCSEVILEAAECARHHHMGETHGVNGRLS